MSRKLDFAIIDTYALDKMIKTENVHDELQALCCAQSYLEKIGKEFEGVLCYNQADLNDTIQKLHISIGIITVPSREAANVAQIMIDSGIKGILNYTSENLLVPDSIYLEEYDMVTSLEKVAYFVKHS